jgi:transcriptional regulator with XRE-family HTH domain
MSNEQHPLITHLKSKGESLTDFAKRLNMSRMQLYRIMRGENTTIDRVHLISEATGNKVPVSAFLRKRDDAA